MHEPLSRLSELQRRVQSDPAPFVFAQLAEEYCRAGRFAEAIACSRTGLERHPGYLTARLILGRALAALSRWEEAAVEYTTVVNAIPDNLAATRELAQIHDRQGHVADALHFYRRALALARNDKGLEAAIAALAGADAPPPPAHQESPSQAHAGVDFDAVLASLGHPDQQPPPLIELLLTDPTALLPKGGDGELLLPVTGGGDDAFGRLERDLRERVGHGVGPVATEPGSDQPSTAASVETRIEAAVLADLEAWLDVLARDRAASFRPDEPSAR